MKTPKNLGIQSKSQKYECSNFNLKNSKFWELQLINFFRVAMKLKDLYSKSVKVEPQRLEQRDIQNQLQMVYVDKSHDYCEKNNREGSTGTQGR